MNYSSSLTELCLSGLYPIFSLYLFDFSESSKNIIDVIIIIIIYAIIGSHIIASFYMFFKTIKEKIIERRRAKISPQDDNKPEIRISHDIDDNEISSELSMKNLLNTPHFISSFHGTGLHNSPQLSLNSERGFNIVHIEDGLNIYNQESENRDRSTAPIEKYLKNLIRD